MVKIKRICEATKKPTKEDYKIILDTLRDYIYPDQEDIVEAWLNGEPEEYLYLKIPYNPLRNSLESICYPLKFDVSNNVEFVGEIAYHDSTDTVCFYVPDLDFFMNSIKRGYYQDFWDAGFDVLYLKDESSAETFAKKCIEYLKDYGKIINKILDYLNNVANNANAIQELLYSLDQRPQSTNRNGK